MGHARALLSLDTEEEQLLKFKEILENKLSVRAIEEKVKIQKSNTPSKQHASDYSPETRDSLSSFYDTRIKIQQSKNGSGKIHLNFSNENEFQRLIKLLLQK
jgi:ParB family chromosome partitioning protein